jgi:hypothetical protein
LESLPEQVPLIVLGGAGFIGRRLVAQYRAQGRVVYVVDPLGAAEDHWPSALTGQVVMVLNLTRKYALESYEPLMWAGMVLLNEVYPAPSSALVQALAARGVSSYHVVGVCGWAIPSFPASYAGAIPCCAAQAHGQPTVVLRNIGTALA